MYLSFNFVDLTVGVRTHPDILLKTTNVLNALKDIQNKRYWMITGLRVMKASFLFLHSVAVYIKKTCISSVLYLIKALLT